MNFSLSLMDARNVISLTYMISEAMVMNQYRLIIETRTMVSSTLASLGMVKTFLPLTAFTYGPKIRWTLRSLFLVTGELGRELLSTRCYILRPLGLNMARDSLCKCMDLHTSAFVNNSFYPYTVTTRAVSWLSLVSWSTPAHIMSTDLFGRLDLCSLVS